MNRRLCVALLGAIMMFSFSAPTVSLAQKASTKTTVKLPSADKIMDDAAAAMGGKAAFDRIKTIKMSGNMSVSAQNINGTMTMQMAFPDKIYIVQQISGFGKAEQGFDGKIGWSRDPINGLRTLAGAELRQMRSQSEEIKSSDWRKLYLKPVVLGIRKVGTMDTYAIRMTPKNGGKPVVTCYDIKTKLPVRSDLVAVTAQGSIPTQSFSSDYRTVGGVKMPFKTRQVVGGTEISVIFDSIQINTPVDNNLFEKPKAPAPKATE